MQYARTLLGALALVAVGCHSPTKPERLSSVVEPIQLSPCRCESLSAAFEKAEVVGCASVSSAELCEHEDAQRLPLQLLHTLSAVE